VFIYVGPESLSKSEHAARPKKPNLSGGSEKWRGKEEEN
jgi:hypothetical protein